MLGLAVLAGLLAAVAAWQLTAVRPAPSLRLQAWHTATKARAPAGAALFALGDFGALDLDTLQTTAMPWPVLASALALAETGGNAAAVTPQHVIAVFKRFGFLYPRAIADHPDINVSGDIPLGFSVGRVERWFPPIRITAINIGCAACHAAPAYRADGTPDPDLAVLGRPNTGLDLEALTQYGFKALTTAFADPPSFSLAMQRLFPDMSLRERLTLNYIVIPAARKRVAALAASLGRSLPFSNGAPGLTNGVGALKHQLHVKRPDRLNTETGFVSVPDLADRSFRSALLADGAYAPKNTDRFRLVTRQEALHRDPRPIAAIASFFMVPSMGLSPARTEAAIPQLTQVAAFLSAAPPRKFPGVIDKPKAAAGRLVYARACASCHGQYDTSLKSPKLLAFPNWAGDVGTDRTRADVFDATLKAAVDQTPHGHRYIDAASTGRMTAQLLSGLWSSAPYFTNGSIPTLRHLLEPETRPRKFMTGGHRLNLDMVGVDGKLDAEGTWATPPGYQPYSTPALIDTTMPGFSNRGHEIEVRDLSPQDRTNLLDI
ncbi:MAG: hypothetical protein R3D67_08025 [Hyphomicrobiaceae bacterium]